MGVALPPVAALQPSQPNTVHAEEATSFDERWAAWHAKGAVVFYALLGR
jgi:hypothetical protein